MTLESNETITSVLRTAAESDMHFGTFGPSMVISAEGQAAYVRNSILAMKRNDDESGTVDAFEVGTDGR